MKREITIAVSLSIVLSGCSPQVVSEPLKTIDKPTQEVQPIINDWSIDFSRLELMEQALNTAHEYFSSDAESASDITLFAENTISQSRIDKINTLSEQTLSSFYGYVPDNIVIIAGTTQQFMSDTIRNNSIDVPPDGNQESLCGILVWEDSASGCTWQNAAWLGFGQEAEEEIHALNNLIPHELFHNIQAHLAGGTQNTMTMPSWFLEGSAEFIGYAITDYLGYFSYSDLAYEDWHYIPNPATGLEFWTTPPPSRSIPFENYIMGQLATEYLVSNVGMDGLLNVFTYAGQGMRFDEAFEEATGISLTKFYAVFNIANQKMLQKDTGDFRTFENRLCPERFNWNCDVDNYKGLEWWQLLPVSIELPAVAENLNHDRDTHHFYIDFTLDNCEQMLAEIGTVAVSSEYATEKDMVVSTQWYARQSHLDTNMDGIVCGSGDSM